MIGVVLLLALAAGEPADDDGQLRALVARSNECLAQEVGKHVPPDKTSLTDDERSAIRMAAVTACDHFNGEIAPYTTEYQSKRKTLAEVSEEMRVVSLRIAEAMAVTRAKQNAKNRKQDAEN